MGIGHYEAIPVFRPQYFLYLLLFWGRDVKNTDPGRFPNSDFDFFS